MAIVEADARTIGWSGASIGTSLAFEAITNTGEFENIEPAKVLDMESIWLNLRTLSRNAINAFSTEEKPYLKIDTVIEAVNEDIAALRTLIEGLNPNCDLRVYLCTYESANKDFPDAKFKNSNTPKQQQIETLDRGVFKYFVEESDEELLKFDWRLKGHKRCVLLTHLPLDLVSHDKFPELLLLESHTGKLKARKDWHTKINKGKTDAIIPFNKAMLVIFGDAMFSPQPMPIRKMLLKISEKRQWHPLTTIAKIVQDIELEYEPHLLEFVRKYK